MAAERCKLLEEDGLRVHGALLLDVAKYLALLLGVELLPVSHVNLGNLPNAHVNLGLSEHCKVVLAQERRHNCDTVLELTNVDVNW